MILRRITSDDLVQVKVIQGHITRAEVSTQWEEMLAGHVDNQYRLGFVAEENGTVIGFILGEIKVGEFGTELSGWLATVGVSPESMGKGIGSKLALKLFQEFREKGVQEVFTTVLWDSGDMLAFFKSLGFDRSAFINLQLGLQGV